MREHVMKECTFRPATGAAANKALIARLLAESDDDSTGSCVSYKVQAARC